MRALAALLALAAGAAQADDDTPRLVDIGDVAGAMQTHFAPGRQNCYALADGQVTGPLDLLQVLHDGSDPTVAEEWARNTEHLIGLTAHGPNPAADGPDQAQWVSAHCRITGAHLHCYTDGDGGRFDLYDAGYDQILLRVYWLVGMVEDVITPTDAFDPVRYGAAFLLNRMDDAACARVLAAE